MFLQVWEPDLFVDFRRLMNNPFANGELLIILNLGDHICINGNHKFRTQFKIGEYDRFFIFYFSLDNEWSSSILFTST